MRVYPFIADFVVTSDFGARGQIKTSEGYASRNHLGIDLVGKVNIDVVACESGTVTHAQYGNGVGNYVWVKGDSGYGTIYQHLASISVKVGQSVSAKQKLGVMGNTGNSSGPHLHFGVATNSTFKSYYDNAWIDPALWFGMNDTNNLVGKTFSGGGSVTGYEADITSENNTKQVVAANTSNDNEEQTGLLDAIVPSGTIYSEVQLSGVLGDWLYGRKYRIFVDLGDGSYFDVSELRCTFEIIKTAFMEANQSTLTIYNLSPENENKLIKEGQRIIIEAGYVGSQYGVIFSGNVIQPLRTKENGVDYLLTLVSMDADRYATYGLVGVSLVAQQSSRDAVDALANKATYPVELGYIKESSISYPRGKVMFGMAKTFLEQIARSENSAFYIEDGKVNIVAAEGLPDDTIFEFGPETGLVGTPTQLEFGIECTVLLNPALKINSLFKIDNQRITNYRYTPGEPVRALDSNGIYRVIKLTHTGDTRGTEWTTKIEAISQVGALPGMMSGSSIYAW